MNFEKIKKSLEKEKGEDAIINEFLKVLLDVSDMMIAWKKNDYQNISVLSGKLFGSINEFNLLKLRKD